MSTFFKSSPGWDFCYLKQKASQTSAGENTQSQDCSPLDGIKTQAPSRRHKDPGSAFLGYHSLPRSSAGIPGVSKSHRGWAAVAHNTVPVTSLRLRLSLRSHSTETTESFQCRDPAGILWLLTRTGNSCPAYKLKAAMC